MIGYRSRELCIKLFLNLEILPLPSQYILSLLLFTIRNKNQFKVNSKIHQITLDSTQTYTNPPQMRQNTRREYTVQVLRCLTCFPFT